jgi:hypothetical protein
MHLKIHAIDHPTAVVVTARRSLGAAREIMVPSLGLAAALAAEKVSAAEFPGELLKTLGGAK